MYTSLFLYGGKGITDPVDYDRYPSEAVQLKWIRYYLEEVARIKGQLLPTYIYMCTHTAILASVPGHSCECLHYMLIVCGRRTLKSQGRPGRKCHMR